ncbi:MAG: redoxin family protein [Thermoanaerobaculia bacterium]
MEQLLQLERLKKTFLQDITILAISPDTPEKTREFLAKVESSRGVHLSHLFLSDPEMKFADAYGIRNTAAPRPLPHPTSVLVNRDGLEVWRFTEKDYTRRPTDDELKAAVAKLKP